MGPLQGIKIIEFAGLGPAPFCGMLLSDLGAEVVRIERPSTQPPLFDPSKDILNRGRRSLELDLKHPPALAAVRTMLEQADALIEGFRPGVMERLGLGPDECLTRNPKLVYGRMTGWGQDGPLAHSAGHDINYIALTGALHAIGRSDSGPVPPLNLVGDFGGGALFLALGITAALLETRQSGQGQVVDAAMTDGAALLMAMMYSLKAMGQWRNERGSNMLDSGAPFYDTYQCADGRWVAIGPIEPQFYTLLLEKCGLQDDGLSAQWDR
ncbi:MAG: CoA transferase, partial [Candidatus Competibacteraceae bacterium]|nr:CoA transferase [Candidatus Competibacteraceae bacterium]